LTYFLDGRQYQADQDGNNGNDDEKLNQGEAEMPLSDTNSTRVRIVFCELQHKSLSFLITGNKIVSPGLKHSSWRALDFSLVTWKKPRHFAINCRSSGVWAVRFLGKSNQIGIIDFIVNTHRCYRGLGGLELARIWASGTANQSDSRPCVAEL
jgi:hypothetical protein